MENELLYLFTTIAQCLAGAIALLAAFALYRLQSIDSAMSDLCKLLAEVFSLKSSKNDELASLEALRTEGQYEEFISRRAELLVTWDKHAHGTTLPTLPLSAAQLNRLRTNMAEHNRIKTALWNALIATGIVMSGSIAATPTAHFLITSPCVAWSVVAVAVTSFSGCLWLYYDLIRAALSGR